MILKLDFRNVLRNQLNERAKEIFLGLISWRLYFASFDNLWELYGKYENIRDLKLFRLPKLLNLFAEKLGHFLYNMRWRVILR